MAGRPKRSPGALPEILRDLLPEPTIESEVLGLALTHSSLHPDEPQASNERLEFLGDAVLGMIVGEYLFTKFPFVDEGRLSKIRAAVVNAEVLSEVGEEIGIGEALRVTQAEELSEGRGRSSIVADALEAVIGAVYLSAGLEAAKEFVLHLLAAHADALVDDPILGDFKSRLQEYLARIGSQPPVYSDTWSGPDHDRVFTTEVLVEDEPLGSGQGASKKQAHQRAARVALERLASRSGSIGLDEFPLSAPHS